MSKKAEQAASPDATPVLPVLSPEQAAMLLAARARHLGVQLSGGETTVDGVTHRARVVDGERIEIASEPSVQSVSALRDELRATDRALQGAASRRKMADANAHLGDDEAAAAVDVAEEATALQARADELRRKISESSGETVVSFPLGQPLAFEVRA